MILVDSSVWVDHFRHGSARFAQRLEKGEIATHIVVLGELATGNLTRRLETLAALHSLPRVKEASNEECYAYIESHRLFCRGIGWNDIQLLVAARLGPMPLWSLDRNLTVIAARLDRLYRDA